MHSIVLCDYGLFRASASNKLNLRRSGEQALAVLLIVYSLSLMEGC